VEEVRETRWAREARLAAEEVERRRRRLTRADHYLSELSLTQEELDEPNDPFHVTDALWDQTAENSAPEVVRFISDITRKSMNLDLS